MSAKKDGRGSTRLVWSPEEVAPRVTSNALLVGPYVEEALEATSAAVTFPARPPRRTLSKAPTWKKIKVAENATVYFLVYALVRRYPKKSNAFV